MDTLNLSSDQLRGLFSLLMEGKLQQVVGQAAAKSIDGGSGNTQRNSNTKSSGSDGDREFNIPLGSSLGDPAAEKYTALELLEKAGHCKKSNPAQQLFRVSN